MTQHQQVIQALEKIGGSGTAKQIYDAVDDINTWKAKNKMASLASYLTLSADIKRGAGGIWTYIKDETSADDEDDTGTSDDGGKNKSDGFSRGLYLIAINPQVKILTPGFLFKIGMSGRASSRLKEYGASLPYNPIELLAFYPVPDTVRIEDAEKEVRLAILTQQDDSQNKFKITRFFTSNQVEWLHTLNFDSTEINKVHELARFVAGIVNDTIQVLSQNENEG